MANPYQYTFRRRVLLQITMVGFLLLTLGLAALVTRSRTYAPPAELTSPVELGNFQVPLPKGWEVSRQMIATMTPSEQLSAMEPVETGSRPMRVLEVEAHNLPSPVSPRKYIRTVHSIQSEIESSPISIDGTDGELFELESRGVGADTRLIASHLYAVCMIESGILVIVHLEIPLRAPNAADRRLIRDITGGMKQKSKANTIARF